MELFKAKTEDKRIIIINGSGGVGKDTFVNLVNEGFQDYFDFHNPYAKFAYSFSSVDIIKQAAKVLGWNGDKKENSRKFLSNLKELSAGYNDYPHKTILNEIDSFRKNTVNFILFVHIREPKDIERLKEEMKQGDIRCKTLLIKNPNIPAINSNIADANVENYDYDYIFNNDGGIDDLRNLAVNFIKGEYGII